MVLDWGDSVAMLLHDTKRDEIVLVGQARVATGGKILELPAGKVDKGETAVESAKREMKEETGAEAQTVQHIFTFYLSPGILTEKLHLFYCPFPTGLQVSDKGGLEEEGEDIEIHKIGLGKALGMVRRGQIMDAKTILAILWLSNLKADNAL